MSCVTDASQLCKRYAKQYTTTGTGVLLEVFSLTSRRIITDTLSAHEAHCVERNGDPRGKNTAMQPCVQNMFVLCHMIKSSMWSQSYTMQGVEVNHNYMEGLIK